LAMKCWRPERGRITGAVDSWQQPWQSFRRSTESHNGSRRCGGGTQARGTRPEGGGHRRAYRVPPRRALYGGRICLLAGLIHGEDPYSIPSAMHMFRARIAATTARIARSPSAARAELLIRSYSDQCTMGTRTERLTDEV
jgi:hypothetical protein